LEIRRLDAPWLNEEPLRAVFSALGAPETDVRAVGGCVRDGILGRAVRDIDLATPDVPDTVIERLEKAGLKAVPTGLEHGTVTAVFDGRGFEITTLRKDTACDGRHADVEFTKDWREAAARRDFTFHAMSMRPTGEVFDFFGGWEDAERGAVVFVGDPADRIQEDYLRILRFFRFYAHYGRCAADPGTLEACHTYRAQLKKLSAERVRNELVKMLTADEPAETVRMMSDTGVLAVVLPEAKNLDVFDNLIAAEGAASFQNCAPDWRRRWVALVPGGSGDVAKRLHMSNADRAAMRALEEAALHVPVDQSILAMNTFLYRYAPSAVDAALIASARAGRPDGALWPDLVKAARDWAQPDFPVSGAELTQLGIPEGPQIGDILRNLEDRWIASGFTDSKAVLLDYARAEAAKKGG